ncbi:MAG: aromatic amino acid ammonia-lyase [bacterium]|nr:aromatic amino acid ammonia-lyase [bacterium]
MNRTETITIGNGKLTINDCVQIARNGRRVELDKNSYSKIERSLGVLMDFSKKHIPVYGLSTQFGNQVNMVDERLNEIDQPLYVKYLDERQINLIKSHSISMGPEIPEEIIALTMALRANCLSLGYSGVRVEAIQYILDVANKGIHPVVKKYGSIGASGDLIPLAQIAAAMIGEDVPVNFLGRKMSARRAFKTAGILPLMLRGREGLAMINGTSLMSATATLAFYDLDKLFFWMLSSIAMALESACITDSPYAPIVHKIKNHKSQEEIAKFMRLFWQGSKLIRSLDNTRQEFMAAKNSNDLSGVKGLQDYYSLRSVAQGFGPFKDSMAMSKQWIEEEINSVNDNPIVDSATGQIYHGANFMGYYITSACDLLKTDISQASTWLHAILANMVHPRKNFGLPANLVEEPAVYSGFRPMQILAASLAVENRKLAQSHQSHSLPTEGDNQDVNSLGTHAAFDLRESVANLERLTAILMLASCQSLELRGIQNAGNHSQKIYNIIRKVSPSVKKDRSMSGDLERIISLIRQS